VDNPVSVGIRRNFVTTRTADRRVR
jgi:hypothetical protein